MAYPQLLRLLPVVGILLAAAQTQAVSYTTQGAPANFYMPGDQTSIPEVRFPSGADDLPLDVPYPDGLGSAVNTTAPDGINLIYISPSEVTASWTTGDYQDGDSSTFSPVDVNATCHTVAWGTSPDDLSETASGTGTSYSVLYYYAGFDTKDLGCDTPTTCDAGQCDVQDLPPIPNCGPMNNYTSATIHHVPMTGLEPSTTYYYQVGCEEDGLSDVLSFVSLPAITPTWEPYRIAMWADVGQTYNTSVTVQHMIESNANVSVLIGDWTYSDDYLPNGHIQPDNYSNQVPTSDAPKGMQPDVIYAPRWDSWYRLLEPLWSTMPFIGAAGNHEIESQLEYSSAIPYDEGNAAAFDLFKAYSTRYGQQGPWKNTGLQSEPSASVFSVDLPGIHLVALNDYIGPGSNADTSYYLGSGSPVAGDAQYEWLENDLLNNFNRSLTPWLMVVFHQPWYNTYTGAFYGVECFRQAFEPLFYNYGVDIVLSGHIHAYERFSKTYNYEINECGPYYMTIGDAGNIEGLTTTFTNASNCDKAIAGGDKCAPATCPGNLYSTQPEFSEYREPSFGHIVLDVLNETAITMEWHRNQDGENVVADSYTFERFPQYCTNQAQPTMKFTAPAPAPGEFSALAPTPVNALNEGSTSTGATTATNTSTVSAG